MEEKCKKNVIIYGVANIELRRKVEFFLEDKYNIIGYSDSFLPFDVLDHKAFFSPQTLCFQKYNYIICCVETIKSYEQICKFLHGFGIEPSSIIFPYVLVEKQFYKQKDLIKQVSEKNNRIVDLLICGLSYSLYGIEPNIFSGHEILNLSWHGLDLYYNYKLYLLCKKYNIKINSCLLVLPYYYFFYDMSRSPYQYKTGQIMSVSRLNDYHNSDNIYDEVSEYICNFKLFSKKLLNYCNYEEKIYEDDNGNDPSGKVFKVTRDIWDKKMYVDAFNDNVATFRIMVDNLLKESISVIVVVPPFFTESYDKTILEEIEYHKKMFYDVVKQFSSVKIIDCFGLFNEPNYFKDDTHLNYFGALAFSEYIKNKLF